MSFIMDDKKGQTYAPGYFLAHEECVRETREIAQNSTLVITADDGAKYMPMGVAYPSNDGYATGIVYEDVDVTTGNMPGSVVTKGVVIEDRLAITGESYDAASDITSADNPTTKGWYEKSGNEYSASSDTVASRDKDYYTRSGSSPDYVYTKVTEIEYGDNPKALGLYERSGEVGHYVYTLSTDTQAAGSKTYYERSDVRLASAAKSALAALGFTFVSETSVVRPY